MNQRGCGRKMSQSTELEYYPDTTGKHNFKSLIIYKVTWPGFEPRAPEYKTGDRLILLKWVQQKIFYHF